MTHTFDSEVSLHYWMVWPTVGHSTVFDTKCENGKIFRPSATSVESQTKIKLVTFDQICF